MRQLFDEKLIYRECILNFQQEPVVEREPSNNAYNDFMVNYLLENSEPVAAPVQPEEFDLQRRSDSSFSANNGRQGMIQLSNVIEANKNVNNTQKVDTTQAPSAPVPSQVPPQVRSISAFHQILNDRKSTRVKYNSDANHYGIY